MGQHAILLPAEQGQIDGVTFKAIPVGNLLVLLG
jgi:hypothetical protein